MVWRPEIHKKSQNQRRTAQSKWQNPHRLLGTAGAYNDMSEHRMMDLNQFLTELLKDVGFQAEDA